MHMNQDPVLALIGESVHVLSRIGELVEKNGHDQEHDKLRDCKANIACLETPTSWESG